MSGAPLATAQGCAAGASRQHQGTSSARALIARPKLLPLDKPSLGLSPLMTAAIGRIIRASHQRQVSIILVEQHAWLALTLGHHGDVLETGQMVLHGPISDLLADERVKRAYLGV